MTSLDKNACLQVEALGVSFGENQALRGVSLSLPAGESLGVLGERGAGKSALLQALLHRLPKGGRVTRGRALFYRADLLLMRPDQLHRLLGDRLTLLEAPLGGLGKSLGRRLTTAIRRQRYCTKRDAWELGCEMLALVGFPSPRRQMDAHLTDLPPALALRGQLALALATDPKLLLADEPTRDLSLIEERAFFQLLEELRGRLGTALLLTTSHPRLAALCRRTTVLCQGLVMEEGESSALLSHPENPYTRHLLLAEPLPIPPKRPERQPFLEVSPFDTPPLLGCPHSDCCSQVYPPCRGTMPPLFLLEEGHRSRCWHSERSVRL